MFTLFSFTSPVSNQTPSFLQSVLPFYVATKLSKIRRATLDKPSPQRYVAAELNTVGLESQTNGYLPHSILVRACELCGRMRLGLGCVC